MSKFPFSTTVKVTIVQNEDGSTRIESEHHEEALPDPGAVLGRALGELLGAGPAGHAAREALAMRCRGVGRAGAGALAHAIVAPLERFQWLLARDGAEAWWTERDGMLAADAAFLDAIDEPAEESATRTRFTERWLAARERIRAGRARVSLRPGRSALIPGLMDPYWGHFVTAPEEALSDTLSPFWVRWLQPTEPKTGVLAILVQATWDRHIGPELGRKGGPALPARSLTSLIDAVVPPKRRARVRSDGQYELVLANDRDRVVARVEPDPRLLPVVSAEAIEALVAPSATAIGIRVVRYVAREAFLQSIAGNTSTKIIIEGGFQALAARLGVRGRRSAEALPLVIKALSVLRVDCGGDDTWLLQYKRSKHTPTIVLTIGDALLPGAVHALDRRTSEERAQARLVPIPRLTPAPVLSPQYRARESALQLVTMGVFAERAPEFAAAGGIKVTDRDWRALSDRAGLTYATVRDRVIPAWQSGEERFLDVDRGRWTLGPAYADERHHLEITGGLRSRATERGRWVADRRRGARTPRGRP
jgi:hypothetical protein